MMYRTCGSMDRSNFSGLAQSCAVICILGMYGCSLIVSNTIAYGEVTQNGFRWVGDDLVGAVRSVREEEIQLRSVGTEWIEGESTRVVVSTFNKDRTFWETLQLKPLPNEQSARHSLCFARGDGNRIVESFVCDAEKRPIDGTRAVYRYDSKGNLVEERVERVSGQPDSEVRNVYEYDSTGRKSSWRLFDSEGGISTITTFTPNTENTLLTVQVNTATGDFQAKEVHTLDSMGRATKILSFDHEGKVISRTYLRYDAHGKRTERIFTGQGVNVREVDSYEYDKQGNWVKKSSRKITPTGEQRSIVRRVIDYFPS